MLAARAVAKDAVEDMRDEIFLVFLVVAILCVLGASEASVFAKSTKTECVLQGKDGAELKTRDGHPCKQKLVVALTVTANEVSC